MDTITLACEGCDATFTGTTSEAFDTGWDGPTMGFQHTTCPDCLITCTTWWAVAIEKKQPTPEQIDLLNNYMAIMLASDNLLTRQNNRADN